jgi:hypothetical protein
MKNIGQDLQVATATRLRRDEEAFAPAFGNPFKFPSFQPSKK